MKDTLCHSQPSLFINFLLFKYPVKTNSLLHIYGVSDSKGNSMCRYLLAQQPQLNCRQSFIKRKDPFTLLVHLPSTLHIPSPHLSYFTWYWKRSQHTLVVSRKYFHCCWHLSCALRRQRKEKKRKGERAADSCWRWSNFLIKKSCGIA